MNNKEFGALLRQIRKSKGLTQQKLAEKAEIDEKHLSRIEKGKFFPTYKTLLNLLESLGITISDVGLNLNNVKLNTNPLYTKALNILNSAKTDDELLCYLNALKCTQQTLHISAKNN